MKKVLFVLVFVLTLCFNCNVFAKEIIGYMECKYTTDYNISKYNSSQVYFKEESGKQAITFSYSQIKLERNDYAHFVYVKAVGLGAKADTWHSVARAAGAIFANATSGGKDQFSATFETTTESNGLNCPKYFVIKDENDKQIPYFANKIRTSKYCGEDMKACGLIAELQDQSKKTLFTDEFKWQATTSGDGACNSANLGLFINDKNMLRAEISYPKDSSFYFDTSQKKVVVDVVGDKNEIIMHNYVRDLVTKNYLGKYFFRSDPDNEKFHLNESGVHKATCTDKDGTTFKLVRTSDCKQYSDFESEITKYKNSLDPKRKNFDLSVLKLIDEIDEDNNQYNAKDFSGASKEELLSLVKQSYTDMSSEEMINLMNEYADYSNEIGSFANENNVCESSKYQLNIDLETAAKTLNNLQAKHEAYTESIENIKKRLIELGASEEELKTVKEILAAKDKIMEAINKGITIAKRASLITKDINLNFSEGCGMITPKLREWLTKFLDILKIAALILTLLLGIVDFLRAVASGNADTMKKIWTRFSKRLLVVALLFLLPVILEFVLGLIKINGLEAGNPLCGIK